MNILIAAPLVLLAALVSSSGHVHEDVLERNALVREIKTPGFSEVDALAIRVVLNEADRRLCTVRGLYKLMTPDVIVHVQDGEWVVGVEEMKQFESDYQTTNTKCEHISSEIKHLSTHYDMGVAMVVRKERNLLKENFIPSDEFQKEAIESLIDENGHIIEWTNIFAFKHIDEKWKIAELFCFKTQHKVNRNTIPVN